MLLAQTIVNTAIEGNNYKIDLTKILKEAAIKGCLHCFRDITKLPFEEIDYDENDIEDIVTILLNNNDTNGMHILSLTFPNWKFYLPKLIDNEEMFEIVLDNIGGDESILSLLAESGNMSLIGIAKDMHLSIDTLDHLIEISSDHKGIQSKLVLMRDYQLL